MRILSADDKPENLYMLEALLRGHGHTVDSVSNGLDALRLAERGVYDTSSPTSSCRAWTAFSSAAS